MRTKVSLFISISICILLLNGCIIFPFPEGTRDTFWTINSDSIENIVRVQFVPERIHHIKGNRIKIFFKDDVCPCVNNRWLNMKVSEVNSEGVMGSEINPDYYYHNAKGDPVAAQGGPVADSAECKTFATANEIIIGAENFSSGGSKFYPPSYNLAWEARRALWPPECNSIRAKSWAKKAKQVAEDEGAKALGYDITGTWVSKITSSHPDFFNNKDKRELKLIIDERGNQITATDSSGEAALEAYRIEGSRYDREIKFKFSFPLVSINQLEGKWKVIDGLTIQGSWNDPVGTASGEWNLRKMEQGIKAQKFDKKIYKHLRNWLSQKPPLKIKWEDIDRIYVFTKEIDLMWCAGFIFGGGSCN